MTIETAPSHFPLNLPDRIVESSESSISRTLQNAVANLDEYIVRHEAGLDAKPLKPRQMTVFKAIRNSFYDGKAQGCIVLPTGAGKTVIFSKLIDAIRPKKTLIIEPTIHLVDQSGKEVKRFTEKLEIGKIYSHAKKYGAAVTITTYSSLVEKVKTGEIKPEDYDLIILDEAHEALSARRTHAIGLFTNAIKLGFTATAEYSSHKKVSDLLENEIYRMTIKEAVQEGLISSFQVFVVRSNAELSKVKIAKNDFNQRDLQRAIDMKSRNMQALDLCLNYEYEGVKLKDQKALIFCAGVKHAAHVAELFKENGLRAEVISGEDSKLRQREILDKFEKGEIDKLCSVNLLHRGLHIPGVSVCINLAPTVSLVRAQQRAGRVLGVDPDNPLKMSLIFDFLDLDSEKGSSRIPISYAEIAQGALIVSNLGKTGGRLTKIEGQVTADNNKRLSKGEVVVFEESMLGEKKIIADPQEVMRIVRENISMEKALQLPPEGSATVHDFAMKHHVHDWHVEKMLQNPTLISDSGNHPEYFIREFLGKNGKPIAYMSSELAKRLDRDLNSARSIEEGWHNENEILKIANELLRVGWMKVRKSIEAVRRLDEFKDVVIQMKISSNNVAVEYYPPNFINAVLNNIAEKQNSFSPPLPGWTTGPGLARELGVTPKVASRLVKKHGKDRPGSIRKFRFERTDGRGAAGIYECISPELRKLIIEKEGGLGYAPQGYKPVSVLDKELGVDAVTIMRHANLHPEWFGEYRSKTRLRTVFVSPEGIREIQANRKAA